MPRNSDLLFSPKSVCVIGASNTKTKVGYLVFKNILTSGFLGKVYPVNPNISEIEGIKAYKNVLELPEIVDLAIIAIPASLVSQTLEQIGQKGIFNVVVFSAGFKEIGATGEKLENELKVIASKYNLNLLGPNCLGFANNNLSINATFGNVFNKMGNCKLILQSGAIATSIFDYFLKENIGFSQIITLGNKAVISEIDVLSYFSKDSKSITSLANDQVSPIGLYLEDIKNGKEFVKIAKSISKTNPLFILKPGKTVESANAMKSHTGAIATSDDILDAALKEAGIIRCNTLNEFFTLAKAFSQCLIPSGPKVAIISNAGGPCVISVDAIIKNGLTLAQNPLDLLGDASPEKYEEAIETLIKNKSCNSILVILTPQNMTEIEKTAFVIGNIYKKYNFPIFCSFMGGAKITNGEKMLQKYNLPNFSYPEEAIYAISSIWQFKKRSIKEEELLPKTDTENKIEIPKEVINYILLALRENREALSSIEANDLLKDAGVSVPKGQSILTFEDALLFANKVSFPVVLKLSSPSIIHKKKVGGVYVNLQNEKDLKDAWVEINKKKEEIKKESKDNIAIQIQKELPAGLELIIGVKKDPSFGNVLLFGAGGSYAELIGDSNLSLFPITPLKVKKLVSNSKVGKLLKNVNLNKVYEIILKLSALAEKLPQIKEIEINPAIVTTSSTVAVDCKVLLDTPMKIKDTPKAKGPVFNTAKTLSCKLLAGKVRYFEFKSEKPFNLKPGQYISVKVKDTRINCYSVAGYSGDCIFNLLVDSTPGGPGSLYFENLKPNDTLFFLGPFGNFNLNLEDGSNKLLFFATGSGVAPLKYMIESVLNSKPEMEINLYLGFLNYKDIFFKDYFESLEKQYKNFKFKIAVCNKCDAWQGATGFITQFINEDIKDASNCSAYLCGNVNMISDVTKALLEKGCLEKRIYTEKY